jgi:hypothetical protein
VVGCRNLFDESSASQIHAPRTLLTAPLIPPRCSVVDPHPMSPRSIPMIDSCGPRHAAIALTCVLLSTSCEQTQPTSPVTRGQPSTVGTIRDVSPSSNLGGDAAVQPTQSTSPAMAEQSCEQLFAQDPRDEAWAPKQEQHLWTSLEKMPAVKVRDAACKSKICRLRLEFTSASAQIGFADDLRGAATGFMANIHGDGRRGVVYLIMHDHSTLTARFWVSRSGFALPGPDGTVAGTRPPPRGWRDHVPDRPEGGTP